MADFFSVGAATLNRWKAAHSEFRESVNAGKSPADAEVAASLFNRATGNVYLVEERIVDGKVVPIRKQLPPDVLAQIFWLKNRQPTKWRDRVEVKEDINLNVFPPKAVLDAIYSKALAESEQMEVPLAGRMERLGIVIDANAGEEA